MATLFAWGWTGRGLDLPRLDAILTLWSGKPRCYRYRYANKNYESLIVGLAESETFKLVTHSEGSADGAGVAKYLIEMGQEVETVVHLSPDEGDEFNSPKYSMTYELSYDGDVVTGNKPIGRGVDVRGAVDKFSSRMDQVFKSQGYTKGSQVFNELEALIRQAIQGANQVDFTESASGTTFTIIRDNRQ